VTVDQANANLGFDGLGVILGIAAQLVLGHSDSLNPKHITEEMSKMRRFKKAMRR